MGSPTWTSAGLRTQPVSNPSGPHGRVVAPMSEPPISRDASPVRAQLRQPRLAEMVAKLLRDRIMAGEFGHGDELPRQEDLLAEFQVSKPSIREALRILETEGLITVRRGNVGGAVVHLPRAETAAHMMAMVLQNKQVRLHDVGVALQHIEPLCASLCAGRPDRAEEVVPQLESCQAEARAAIDEPLAISRLALQFHALLVSRCGNATLIALLGTLEALWSGSQQAWTRERTAHGQVLAPSVAQSSLNAHDELIEAIRAGDVDRTADLASAHLQQSHFFAHVGEANELVDVAAFSGERWS